MGKKDKKYKSRLQKADKRLLQAEEDLVYMVEFMNRLQSMNKNMKKLTKYYQGDWLKDIDVHHQSDSKVHHPSASEDGIWDAIQDHYDAKLDLIQLLINDINQK